MAQQKPRKRSEIPTADTWALEDLFPTDEAWEQELTTLNQDQQILASFEGRLGESGETLCRYLTQMEQVIEKLSLLGNYCIRRLDQDTRNTTYQTMAGSYRTASVAMGVATSFETPEIMAIPEETLEDFYAACPGLERYRRFLKDFRRRKAHVLSEAEEKILSAAGEISQSPSGIFSAFTDADLTFPDAVDAAGEKHPLTKGNFVVWESGSDRVLRKSAYENMYHTIGAFRNTAAAVLNAQHKQLKFFAEARKYANSFEASLDGTNVPTSVYLNLIEAVHQNMDKMHRYVRLRKKILGLEEIHFYDIYTSLVPDADREIPFDEAKQTVYDALAPLGRDYQAVLKEGFENRWIDVYENEGKRGGAYSAGTPVHPYVLMNYTGTLDSQFTLAHEMGHAMHSYLSNKHQNPIDSDYVIFVAEVASTCNEALLMQYLLDRTTDKRERAALINHFLEQFKGTIYRQTMFAEFEYIIGQYAAEGKVLTAELLCSEYKRLNELYFGPDMVVDDEIAMEWARIPHFYYDYYVFQYATGFSAAIALSRKILTEGESAVRDYLNFLSGGCSKSPIDLLKGAGVDMTDVKPINDALQLFGTLLDEMEALLED